MRLPPLRDRDRRALLLGVLVLGPALFFTFGVKPYAAAWAEARGRLDAGRGLLERERRLLAGADGFPDVLARSTAALRREAPRLFTGTDPLAATGALAGYVAGHARASRLLLEQAEPVGVEPVGNGLVALRLSVRATGDLDGILAFLDALEEGRRLVRVERLALERAERYGPGARTEGEAEDMIVLALSAVMSGYAVVEGRGGEHTATRVTAVTGGGGS